MTKSVDRKEGGIVVPSNKLLWIGLGLFVTVAVLIVVVNSLMGYGFHLEYSISKYVGMEVWSSVLFLLSNIVVASLVGRYAWGVGKVWKMPRLYYCGVFVIVVALLWLSVCPVGMCDVDGSKSLMTWLHEIASRTMFLAMLVVGVIFAASKRASKTARLVALIFVICGTACVAGYFMKAVWFKLLICESLYIDSFMALLVYQRKMVKR